MTILPKRRLYRLWGLLSILWLVFVLWLAYPQMSRFDVYNYVGFTAAVLVPSIILFLICFGISWTLEHFGEVHWLKVPQHLRQGLLRLYVVVAVPWVAWYGYKICDVVLIHTYWRWHDISRAFWSLLIVPIGGPILFLAIVWVILGFREPPPQISETQNSKVGGATPRPNSTSRQSEAVRSAKTNPDYSGAGKILGEIFVNPTVWREINKLRDYRVPDSVASYEVAFARVAIMKETIRRCEPNVVATEMLAGVDNYIAEAFVKEGKAEVLNHYEHIPLSIIAPEAIRLYEENVFPLTELAIVLAHRLSIVDYSVVEIAAQFEEVRAEAEQLMKVSASMQRIMQSRLQ